MICRLMRELVIGTGGLRHPIQLLTWGGGSELNLLRANNQASKLKGPLNPARPSHAAPSHWFTDGESKAGEAEPLPKSFCGTARLEALVYTAPTSSLY